MNKTFHSRLPLAAISIIAGFVSSCDPGIQSEETFSVEAETIRVTNSPTGKFEPAWSPDGRMIAYTQYDPGSSLYKYSLATGRSELLLEEDDFYLDVKLSPDGSKVVYRSGARKHLWVRSLQDGSERQLTTEQEHATGPIWSADGKWVAFNALSETSSLDLWIVPSAGGVARKLFSDEYIYACYSFSPDGEKIALYSRRSRNYEIWTIDTRSGELKPLTAPPYEKRFPAWSPDGMNIAYIGYDDSCTTNASTVWLIPASGGRARELATLDGHIYQLAWSPDGTSLVADTGNLFLISAANGRTTRLFSPRTEQGISWFPDGQSLLLMQEALNYAIYAVSLDNMQARKISDRKIDLAFHPIWLNAAEVAFVRNGSQLLKVALAGGNAVRVGDDSTFLKNDLAISPDRKQIVFDNGFDDIYLQALAGGPPVNLTEHTSDYLRQPSWSPDGKSIVCSYYAGLKVFALVSGKLVERKILSGLYREPDWSRSADFSSPIAFESAGHIYLTTLDDAEPRLATTEARQPAWSPDGRWLAYIREQDIFVTKIFDTLK